MKNSTAMAACTTMSSTALPAPRAGSTAASATIATIARM